MNHALTTTENTAVAITMGFGDLASFEFLQRTAKAFSSSTMVPTAYQAMVTKGYGDRATVEPNPAALSNCMIALDMATRMNANPLMIMQNLHIIEGRPSWSSQFIIAAINNCGKFSPLRFDLQWLDEIDATYSTFEWEDRRKVEKKHKVRIKNARCVAWAIEKATGERLESAPVTMEMAVNEGWFGKNGSKWKSMPDLMMRYRSAAFFGRIYAPELLMGLPTAEEVHDVFSVDSDGAVTDAGKRAVPPATGNIDPTTGEVRTAELPPYAQEQFDKLLPSWRAAIAAGKTTAKAVIAKAKTKGTLTQEQEAAIRAPIEQPAPQPMQQQAEAVTDVQPKGEPQVMLEKTVGDQLQAAATLDALYEAADLIGEVPDPEQRAALTAVFEERQFALESA
ncbi:hypothetical protein [Diaphorobacter sp. ED-3]|uniref:hypothetical protein n=1 Tax=Diaphorobacter sp. ED-3 TaxID=3016636 RepID=UPI0022DD2823|nr:hypothetical protein [Diaphorobacter sp. ED-3]